jgi:hypothetical protein
MKLHIRHETEARAIEAAANLVGSVVEYRKGRRYVHIYFKATEAVQGASYGNGSRGRRVPNTNQAAFILDILGK